MISMKTVAMVIAAVMLSACGTSFGPTRRAGSNISGHQGHESYGYGPTSDVMLLDFPEPGCPESVLLRIENDTTHDWTLVIDSRAIAVNGDTTYEAMPTAEQDMNGRRMNKSVGFVCLSHPGWHTISGTAYDNRYGQMVMVGQFETRKMWNGPRGANPYNTFYLSDSGY